MKINEIYTAFVAWQGGGKRRPILIVRTGEEEFYFLKVTSKYANKSEHIKQQYYPLQDWLEEGLKKQSYIDTGNLLNLPNDAVTTNYVGKLTAKDKLGLARFLENQSRL
ncbi:MazF family toxin-antitoxin system [Limosilactobacillus reuteri]|uniref:MazF family toxin-antitoxin system n=1 Tax=Limosilactobacillus reuteri TaxID=1598 RepID=UPI001E44940C|nr:MazF family toxin-antitoxin system [Limosilactobacillus reuteri]MCC4414533.1 MazF family toxin-antitoxin system [Limosilactobacillus reuteri]